MVTSTAILSITENWDAGRVTWTIRDGRRVIATVQDDMRRGTIDSGEVTRAVSEWAARERNDIPAGRPYFTRQRSDKGRLIPRMVSVDWQL